MYLGLACLQLEQLLLGALLGVEHDEVSVAQRLQAPLLLRLENFVVEHVVVALDALQRRRGRRPPAQRIVQLGCKIFIFEGTKGFLALSG